MKKYQLWYPKHANIGQYTAIKTRKIGKFRIRFLWDEVGKQLEAHHITQEPAMQ